MAPGVGALGAGAILLGLGVWGLVDGAAMAELHGPQSAMVQYECTRGIATGAECTARMAIDARNAAAIGERYTLGAFGLALGGALAVTGLALLLAGRTPAEPGGLGWLCAPGPGGVGCSGRF